MFLLLSSFKFDTYYQLEGFVSWDKNLRAHLKLKTVQLTVHFSRIFRILLQTEFKSVSMSVCPSVCMLNHEGENLQNVAKH